MVIVNTIFLSRKAVLSSSGINAPLLFLCSFGKAAPFRNTKTAACYCYASIPVMTALHP